MINGAPGSGKSTVAHAVAQDRRMTLALEIDTIKHSLGRWDEDPQASGLDARRLDLLLAGEHLGAGFDVVIGQYLARTGFIEQLEKLADQRARSSTSSYSTSVLPPLLAVWLDAPVTRPGQSTLSTISLWARRTPLLWFSPSRNCD